MKKIKVGFFNRFFPVISGGSEYQTYLLSQCLDPKRFDIFFLSLDSRREGMYKIGGIKVYFFRPHGPLHQLADEGYISNFRYIKSTLQREKPDVIYQMMANTATGILQYLSKKLCFKFIWACASDADLWYLQPFSLPGIRSIPEYFLKRRGMCHADLILVQTEHQKLLIKQQFHRNAVLLRNLHPIPVDVPIKSTEEIRIVWLANLKPLKQPDLFIDLATSFKDLNMVQFVMIGRAGQREWQRKLESRINQVDNISYLGELSQDKINEYLESAHILVNTSKYEGFSNAFIQAWIRKIPVVSLIVDPDKLLSKSGLGYCSGNFDNLCHDVHRLINDRHLRESIGKKARQYACEQHSIDKIGGEFQKLVNLLDSTLIQKS